MSQKFNYQILEVEMQQQIQEITLEIKNCLRRCAQDIITIGNHLHYIKQQLPHGQFRTWLQAEFGWSISAASKFMQVSKCFQIEDVAEIDISPSALYILAAPSTPESVRSQALQQAQQGKRISFAFAQKLLAESKKPEASTSENFNQECLIIETSLSSQIYSFSDFQDYLSQQWQRMAQSQQELSLIIIEINNTISPEIIGKITHDFAGLLYYPEDFVGYNGKGQWMLVLPNTNTKGLQSVVKRCFQADLSYSQLFENLLIGWGTVLCDSNLSFEALIEKAKSSLIEFGPLKNKLSCA